MCAKKLDKILYNLDKVPRSYRLYKLYAVDVGRRD